MKVQDLLLKLGELGNSLTVKLFEVIIHRIVLKVRPDVLSLLLTNLSVQFPHAIRNVSAQLLHFLVLIVMILRQFIQLLF